MGKGVNNVLFLKAGGGSLIDCSTYSMHTCIVVNFLSKCPNIKGQSEVSALCEKLCTSQS